MGKDSSSSSEESDSDTVTKKLIRKAGHNLGIEITKEETKFRKKLFPDVEKVKGEKLKCTVCSKYIVSSIFLRNKFHTHVVLDVLVCEECQAFYGDGDFSTDEDGDDKYCRWCGQGGEVYCCAKCTCVFCKKCVKQNLKRSEMDKLEREDWNCFICRPKALFPLRAECWAVKECLWLSRNKKDKIQNRRTSQREGSSKRKHSSSSEETRSKTKKKESDTGPENKKIKLRSNHSSDEEMSGTDSDFKKKKGKGKKSSEDSCSSDGKSKTNKNKNKTSKKDGSPVVKNSKINTSSKENHVSAEESSEGIKKNRCSTRLVNSKDGLEDKTTEDDGKMKKIIKVSDVYSSDGSKSRQSVKSSNSRGSSVSSESKKQKKQMKLADEFLSSTVQSVQELGEIIVSRVKAIKKKITLDTLKTPDDVFKVTNKLNKLLIGVDKNVIFVKGTLEENVKTWKTLTGIHNADVSAEDVVTKKPEEEDGKEMDKKEDGKETDKKQDGKETDKKEDGKETDKKEESSSPTVLDSNKGMDINDLATDNASKGEENNIDEYPDNFSLGIDIDKLTDALDDHLNSKTSLSDKDVEKTELENNTNGENSKNVVEKCNEEEDKQLIENKEGELKTELEKKNNESKDDEEQDKINEVTGASENNINSDNDEENKIDDACDIENKIDKDNDEENKILNESENLSKINEVDDEESKVCEESDENKDSESCDDNKDNEGSDKDNEGSDKDNEGSDDKNQITENGEEINVSRESGGGNKHNEENHENRLDEEDKAVLAELLTDSSDEEAKEVDKSKEIDQKPSTSSDSEDPFLSDSTDEEKSQRKKKRKQKKTKVNKKSAKQKKEVSKRSDSEEDEEEENGEKKENKKPSSDSDTEIARLTDLSKINKKRKKKFSASSEEKENEESDHPDEDVAEKHNKIITKKKKEKKTDKKEKEEGLLDFLHNDDDCEEDNGKSSSSSEGSFIMKDLLKVEDKSKDLEKQQQEMALKLMLMSSDSEVDKVPAEHDSDSSVSVEDENRKKKKRKRKVKGEDKKDENEKDKDEKDDEVEKAQSGEGEDGSDNKSDDTKKKIKIKKKEKEQSGEGEDDSDTKSDDTKKKIKIKKKEKCDTEEDNDEEKNKKSENDDEDENGKKSVNSDTSSDMFENKKSKKKNKKNKWRQDRLLRIKLSETDTSDEERWWTKRIEKQKAQQNEDLDSSDVCKEKPVVRKAKNKLMSDSDKSNKSVSYKSDSLSSVKISSTEESSWDSEVVKPKKGKRKKGASDSSGSKGSNASSIKKKKKRKRIKSPVHDDETSDSDSQVLSQKSAVGESPGKGGRKNIRKLLDKEDLAEATRKAAKEEEERRRRIAQRQILFYETFETQESETLDKLVLDFDEETKKELISVDSALVKKMKPHQAKGVKFMWDSCFESIKELKTKKGSGCILAHCMGLGKTFQVVSLAHTLLTNNETGVSTILVVCPLSTVTNWYNEFDKWLKDIGSGDDFEVYDLTKWKQNYERCFQLKEWHSNGGVMVLGYEMFRILSNANAKNIRSSLREGFKKTLIDPGPDMIVCDEGHMLKNENTALSKAMSQIRTLRRVVLTGTPMQNNLKEYHCMVQFVKPNLLGTRREFLNRFVNPITNGQFVDSTETDVKIMKRRAHVLHKMLEGLVQRFDYNVLTPFLPPKHEYVVYLRLSEIQIKLYQYYLDHFAQGGSGARTGSTLFVDWQALGKIWTHPRVLLMSLEKTSKRKEKYDTDSEGSLRDFVVDGSEDSTSSESSKGTSKSSVVLVSDDDDGDGTNKDVKKDSSSNNQPSKRRRITRAMAKEGGEEVLVEPEVVQQNTCGKEWWSPMIEPEQFEDINLSAKLILLFGIIRECEMIEDKVLVFSQSLTSLDLIEYFLAKIDEATEKGVIEPSLGNHAGSWTKGIDYFRLDGSSTSDSRSSNIKQFNNEDNTRARLFLISTRAGGLGINLTAANRVIIFDASWNPSHDIQSIFRVYRFGQRKPCYVYRFIAQGTMEEKVYDRQVTKQSLSMRVVDEQQVNRHFSCNDLEELYIFTPKGKTERPVPMLPKDRLMAELLQQFSDWIETHHEHDSLLENVAEEELNEEERKAAWEDYENEKKQVLFTHTAPMTQMQGMQLAQIQQLQAGVQGSSGFINSDMLRASLQKQYPKATEEDMTRMLETLLLQTQYNYRMQYQQPNTVQPQRMVYNNPRQPVIPQNTVNKNQFNQVYNYQRELAFQQQLRAMKAKNMMGQQFTGGTTANPMTVQANQTLNYIQTLKQQQQQKQQPNLSAQQQQLQIKPVSAAAATTMTKES